jgi:ubiquinone biosynthesis protein
MEFIDGCKISDLEKIKSWGLNPEIIANKGIDVMFKQIFVHGFFHADPHPGNVFVMPDGRLCYLDFGMMGTIVSDDRENLSSIFIGIFTNDTRRIVRALRKLSGTRQFQNEELLEHRILELVDQYTNLSLKEIKISNFFNQFKNLIIDYKISVPQDFFLLIKAISTTEGVGLRLYPELNLMKKMEPFVQGMLKRKLNPFKFTRNLFLAATDMSQLIKTFPNDLKDIVDKIRYGVIKVDIEHLGLESLNKTLDKVSNRISFAIIAAAMMIGSSMVVHAKVTPFYNGIPILGLLGFVLAVIFSLILIWSIFRHGKF